VITGTKMENKILNLGINIDNMMLAICMNTRLVNTEEREGNKYESLTF